MSRIRIYQNFFVVPGPAINSRNFTPVLRAVSIRPKTLQPGAGAIIATGVQWVTPFQRNQVLGVTLENKADVRPVTPRLNGAMVATGSNGPELWNPPVAPTMGWAFHQSPLVTRRKSADPECDDATSDVIGPITAPPQSGWSVVLPDLRRAKSFAPMATLDSLSLPLQGDTIQPGWSVTLAELRQAKPRSGFSDPSVAPEAWSPLQTVAAQPWGWSLPPPWTPRKLADLSQTLPRLDQPAEQPFGWNIVTPELLPRPLHRVLTEFTWRFDPSLTIAVGWTVTLPDLPRFKRNQALPDQPAGLERAGAIPAAVNWSVEPPVTQRRPTVLGALAGADLPPTVPAVVTIGPNSTPILRSVNLRRATPRLDGAMGASSELWNPPAPVTTTVTIGWEFQQPALVVRRKSVDPEANILDQIAPQPQSGWSVVQPDLSQVKRTDLGQTLVRLDAPQSQPYGWNIVLPELPWGRRKPDLTWVAPRLDKPTELSVGWNVVQPDLPQFVRRQALPERIDRSDQPSGLDSANSFGWVAELPHVKTRPTVLGAFAGAILTPQVITTVAVGWNIIQPNLPQFRRKIAAVERTDRQDQPQGQPYGWDVVQPDLPWARRIPAITETLPRSDKPAEQPYGWNIVLPDLLRSPRSAQAVDSNAVALGGSTYPWGWSVTLPDLRRVGQNAIGVASDAIQSITATAATGWNIVLPDLLAFRRFQALPEGQGRLDPPVTVTGIVFVEGWSIVLPVTRVQPRTAGVLAGADLPATAPQQQPFGWSVLEPDLPPFRRKLSLGTTEPRLDQSTPSQLFAGWQATLPDLPAFKRSADLTQTLPRLDKPAEVVIPVLAGWVCVLPDLVIKRGWLAALAGADLPPKAPTPKPPGGYPFPVWWPEYVQAERARQRIPREANLYAIAPSPWAVADAEHLVPKGLVAVIGPPDAFGRAAVGAIGTIDGTIAPSGSAVGTVGASARYLSTELRPQAAATGMHQVDATVAVSMAAPTVVARINHARGASLVHRIGLRPQAQASGSVGTRAAIRHSPIGIDVSARATVGTLCTLEAQSPAAESRVAVVCGSKLGISVTAPTITASGEMDHDPDDEETLTAILLLGL